MALHIHRSNRMERLADALAERLHGGLPAAPLDRVFATVPVVVGSRGMASWLGHQLASRRRVLARVDFPFPRQAFDGALAAALGDRPATGWWRGPAADAAWQPDALAWRCLLALRARAHVGTHPAFDQAVAYLRSADGWPAGAVSARELTFARDVADVLDRIGRKRPDVALRWLDGEPDGGTAGKETTRASERWLVELLAQLGREIDMEAWPRQLARLRAVEKAGRLQPLAPHLHVFGLSTQGRSDVEVLNLLGAATEVHLYALAPARTWIGESKRQPAEPGQGCPLLAGLAGPSRDLQVLLEDLQPTYREPESASVFEAPQGDHTLAVLQRGLLDDLPLPEPADRIVLADDDGSVSLHPCPSALRQVEELRDVLLRVFDNGEAVIEARDVVVMTPDIQTYAPLIAAVFATRPPGLLRAEDGTRQAGPLPAIPVHIADLGLRATNPIAEVMARILELASERLDLPGLLDLLALAPIQARFGLDDDDVSDLRRMLQEAGARWALDAADRAAAGQPRLHQNTFEFALERIALGAIFGETDGDLLTATGSADPQASDDDLRVSPYAASDTAGQARFGKLYALLRALSHHRQAVAEATDGAGWRARLQTLRADLCATSDAAAWLEARVDDELSGFFDGLAAAGFDGPIGLDALRSWLQGRFEMPRSGERTITGAVTVCALEPMRSVPFEVVVLLGMDDATFPRVSRNRAWDPMAHDKRVGEHDRRAADRHLLMEAVISARRRLVVTWTASDERTGEPLPPAVPVAELIEAIDGRMVMAADDERASGERASDERASDERAAHASTALRREVPLQPWSGACFDGQRPRAFGSGMLAAALQLRSVAEGETATRPAIIEYGEPGAPPDGRNPAPGLVDFTTLGREVLQPARLLLRGRHDVRLGEQISEVPDREVLELDGLDGWKVREPVVQGLFAGEQADELVDEIAARWRAEGKLQIGPSGGERITALGDEASAVAAAALALLDTDGQASSPFSARTTVTDPAGWRLDVAGNYGRVAAMADGDPRTLVIDVTGSGFRADRLLRPWIALLVATLEATREAPVAAALVTRARTKKPTKTTWLRAPNSAHEAAAHLRTIVSAWRRAHVQRVPLFEGASLALVQTLVEADGLSWWGAAPATRRKAARAFESALSEDDPWREAAWGEVDLDERLPLDQTADATTEPPWVAEAAAIFGPLLAAVTDGPPPIEGSAGEFTRDGGGP